MDWARRTLETRLSAATGHEARIAKVCLAPFGGLQIHALELARAAGETPWLKAHEVHVAVSPWDLLRGRLELRSVTVTGLELELKRNQAGERLWSSPVHVSRAGPHAEEPGETEVGDEDARPLPITVTGGRLTWIDEPVGVRLSCDQLHAQASYDGRIWRVEHLRGRCQGGTLEWAGTLERDEGQFHVQSHATFQNIRLGASSHLLRYVAPLVADGEVELQGIASMELVLHSHGDDLTQLTNHLAGHGEITIDPLSLEKIRFLRELEPYVLVPTRTRVGSIRGTFQVGQQRVSTTDLVWKVGNLPLRLQGWTGFDSHFEYAVHTENLSGKIQSIAQKLPREARELLGEVSVNLDEIAKLRVTGDIDHFTVDFLDEPGKPGSGGIAPRSDLNMQLEQLGRRLKERLVR